MPAQSRQVVHADIRPENTPELASHYLDAPNMPWEKTKFPGIAIKVLYSDDSGITTALFKLDPGAVVPLAARIEAQIRAAVPGITAVRIVAPLAMVLRTPITDRSMCASDMMQPSAMIACRNVAPLILLPGKNRGCV